MSILSLAMFPALSIGTRLRLIFIKARLLKIVLLIILVRVNTRVVIYEILIVTEGSFVIQSFVLFFLFELLSGLLFCGLHSICEFFLVVQVLFEHATEISEG